MGFTNNQVLQRVSVLNLPHRILRPGSFNQHTTTATVVAATGRWQTTRDPIYGRRTPLLARDRNARFAPTRVMRREGLLCCSAVHLDLG